MNGNTRFLVADDEELNLDIISEYLSLMSEAYEVETAKDGQIAWQMINDNATDYYDIVILDNMMPHLSGLDILKNMQAQANLKHIPVVLQSARARKEDVVEGIEAGAFYYLTKPFNEEQFSNVIRNCYRNLHIYKDLQKVLQGNASSMHLLEEATFNFRTIDDVHSIATLVASACPSSERSLTGLFELMLNAVEHGNLGIGYEVKSELNHKGVWADEVNRRQRLDSNCKKTAQVHFKRKKDHIEITISDDGKGFDWQAYMDFDVQRLLDSHGRGIAIANNISFDHLEFNTSGNEVCAHLEVAKK
ncbi:hypothetical protein MNBD_GAMMA23-1073 [hydrothermal vent metagenome]|uniref:Response regulatory domain-containing protein n=1 Tax=hydrothermal vent metagenome TaxID=652676 RepID=A0A3B1A7N5_9ZZZZ